MKRLAKYKKTDDLIDETLGKSFSFIERLKMGGNGCRRMVVEEASPDIWNKIKDHPGLHYSSIELRPKGIIVFFKFNLRDFSWIIPYYQLAIYKSQHFSIHADGHFVKYRLDSVFPANEKFIERMMNYRLNFLDSINSVE